MPRAHNMHGSRKKPCFRLGQNGRRGSAKESQQLQCEKKEELVERLRKKLAEKKLERLDCSTKPQLGELVMGTGTMRTSKWRVTKASA